jgi:hypothetical protein
VRPIAVIRTDDGGPRQSSSRQTRATPAETYLRVMGVQTDPNRKDRPMSEIFKGIRPLDYVLAGLTTVAGLLMMAENIGSSSTDLAHPVSTTTWAMAPAFLLVTLPILWRRRNILAVVGVTAVTTVAHVLAFGWLTRCGVMLPLTFVLAYAVARFAGAWRNQLIGLVGIVLIQLVMLARDSSIDTVAGALVIALPGVALFYGVGVLVQNRVIKQSAGLAPAHERTAA